ncbi:hypothetical protein K438DRAFT_1574876 [Mycena galopus ATCC 62051]|nr:hypothetical protein K438DRAFT_1574876 [Mycena galopus ATCC 62051]
MPKGASRAAKTRAPYASQACTICRSKKSKCDGVKPVCGSCAATGRDDECTWGRDAAPRKPRTEAHFEALRKRADALQAWVERLEGMLSKCVCQDVSAHLQFRPQHRGEKKIKDEVEASPDAADSDEDITKELTVPTQALRLDDSIGNLVFHGVPSSPFRFGDRPATEVSQIPEVVENPDASYVLQLDGVNVSQTHPDIDWSRHLPPEVTLKRKEHDKILDLAFKFSTVWCLRIVPSLFLRDMYRALSVPRSAKPPRTSHYSACLHNALLSVHALYSDDPYMRDRKTRQHFAIAAKAMLEAECWKPDISLVQAVAFIGTFYGDAGERIQAEMFCGVCILSVGLGVDATPWVRAGLIRDDERLARNWCHWGIFALDVCWALYFGRDFAGPPGPRRNIPLPFVDSKMDQVPWHYPPAKIAPQPNYTTLIFFQTSALLVIAREIIDIINGLCPSVRPDSMQIEDRVTKIDLELNNWKSQLPPEVDITLANRAKSTPQRLMLHLMYWWCFVVLHRPFFSRRPQAIQHSDREVDHVKLCTRAAENMLELVETWHSLYTLRFAPITMIQIMFNAATIFLLRALQATASPRIAHGALNTALAQVETCGKYLEEVALTWASAARTKDTLQAILNDRLKPVIARRLAHKTEQTSPAPAAAASASSSSSPPSEEPANSHADEDVTSPLTTMPAPAWNTTDLAIPSWPQVPMDFMQPQNAALPTPASVFGAESLGAIDAFTDVDMTALLPNIDYFGAPEFWEQSVFNDDAGVLFSQASS